MSPAPIILFCYKRIDTLDLTIQSLKKCPEAKYSDLVIYSDAPANDSLTDKVKNVREFIKNVVGFKSIEIIERPNNLGVDFNIIDGLKEVANRFDKFIIIEDDIIVKPDCLTFFNSCLDYYNDNLKIMSISAFPYLDSVPKSYQYDAFFAGRENPWGWATWSDRIKSVDWYLGDKESFLQSKKLQAEFSKWGSDMGLMLKNTINGKIRAWDIRLDYHIYKHDMVVVYSTIPLTVNIGFGRDDSSNTFGYNRFKSELNSVIKLKFNLPDSIFFEKEIVKEFIFKNSLILRIFTRIMKLIGYKN